MAINSYKISIPRILGGFVLVALTSACAGPMSPFGAYHTPPKKDQGNSRDLAVSTPVKISFSPSRQNLHEKEKFSIEIYDPIGLKSEDSVSVFFNETNITASFFYLAKKHIDSSGTRLVISFDKLGLRADQRNNIRIRYKNQLGVIKEKSFESPECPLNESWSTATLQPFKPSSKLISYINEKSVEGGINPSAMVALIAKESGFKSRAISWARALGLTQITPLAEVEVAELHKDFPRYPGINRMGFLKLKSKVLTGEINAKSEWRLNPKYSVIGGVTFVNRLIEYWNRPANLKLLAEKFDDPVREFDRVVLASYNSGSARVKRSIEKYGNQYLWISPSLNAAREYVQKIQSYCYHFTHTDEGGYL